MNDEENQAKRASANVQAEVLDIDGSSGSVSKFENNDANQQYDLYNRNSNLEYFEQDETAKRKKLISEYTKYVTLLLLVMVFTIGGSMFVHRSDMQELQHILLQNKHKDQGYLDTITNQMDVQYRRQAAMRNQDNEHLGEEKVTKEEVESKLETYDFTEKEKKLIEIFQKHPRFTDLQSYKTWKKLGPFNLAKHIISGRVIVDEQYNITTQKHPAIAAYHEGQVNHFFDNNEEGVGRMEWVAGDIYEGESDNGDKQGFGRYIWQNGDYYLGDFNKGELHGYGEYGFSADDYDEKKIGLFKNGVFVKETNEG